MTSTATPDDQTLLRDQNSEDPSVKTDTGSPTTPATTGTGKKPGVGIKGNPPRGQWAKIWIRIRRDPVTIGAIAVLAIVLMCAAFPSLIAPLDPLSTNLARTLEYPSVDHWLGTDSQGRDVISRLVYAARIAVIAAGQATVIAMAIGIPIGLLIGFVGGPLDSIIMRFVDGFTSLPGLIVAIAIIAARGPGIVNAMLAVGLVFSTTFVRVTRGEVLSARRQQYVEAAQVIGTKAPVIMVRHILPNIIGPVAVQVSLTMAAALLVEAALSFLGLGAQPPDASWGVMIAEAANLIGLNPLLILPPGIALGLTVLSLNIVGDTLLSAMRDEPLRTNWRRIAKRSSSSARVISEPTAINSAETVEPRNGVTPTVSLRGLDVTAARGSETITLVDNVSLDVMPGTTLGVVGESGSGKTITALAAMGLLPQSARRTGGRVFLEGDDITDYSANQLRRLRGQRMAMIFQEPGAALDPAFTVGNQITEVLRTHQGLSRADAYEKAAHLLERVGIREPHQRMKSYPHELSGGMAQRVMIALAISCDPVLLIADEPTTALDVTLKVQIAELLAGIQDETGMAMMFVTHELGMVAEVADRVAVMYAGQIVEEQDVNDLMHSPRHPYTSALLQSSVQGQPRGIPLSVIPGTVPSPGNRPQGCRFAPRCEFATVECTSAPPELTPTVPAATLGDAVRCIHPINAHQGGIDLSASSARKAKVN